MEVKLTCVLIDMLIAITLVIMGIAFTKSDGKLCKYIAGYNMKSHEERKDYDEMKICKYFGKAIISWAIPYIIGAIVDCFIPIVGTSLAALLFIIAVFYHVYQSRDKIFDEKFKLHSNS